MSTKISISELRRKNSTWSEILAYAQRKSRESTKDERLVNTNYRMLLEAFFEKFEVYYDEPYAYFLKDPCGTENEIMKSWKKSIDSVVDEWKKVEENQ